MEEKKQPDNEFPSEGLDTIDLRFFRMYDKKTLGDTTLKVTERGFMLGGKTEEFAGKSFAIYLNDTLTVVALQEDAAEGYIAGQQGSGVRRVIACKAAVEAMKQNPNAMDKEVPLVYDTIARCWKAKFEPRKNPAANASSYGRLQ